MTPKTKIVFLANPNNPTGTYVPFDEVKRLHAGLPPHVLLVHRRRLCGIRQPNDYEAGIELVATNENVVMTAHVLENPRPGRAAAWLDLRAGACGRRHQPHPRAVQRQRTGDDGRHRRDRGPPHIRSARARTTTMAAVADRGDRQARAER